MLCCPQGSTFQVWIKSYFETWAIATTTVYCSPCLVNIHLLHGCIVQKCVFRQLGKETGVCLGLCLSALWRTRKQVVLRILMLTKLIYILRIISDPTRMWEFLCCWTVLSDHNKMIQIATVSFLTTWIANKYWGILFLQKISTTEGQHHPNIQSSII